MDMKVPDTSTKLPLRMLQVTSSHVVQLLPTWAPDLLELINNEGHMEDDEEGPVIFANSYFIDHMNHIHHDRPRPLRFDLDTTEWERDIILIWEDYVDISVPLDVVVVKPEPPHFPFRGTVATVIVHQRATFERELLGW